MSQRRYSEDEAREIFGRAAVAREAEGTALARRDGLTLEELEEIGVEVGLDRAAIRDAATAVDLAPSMQPRRSLLGLPVGVGRTVRLPRAFGDREWEVLVSELRQLFDAKGRVESSGNLREWIHGNVHVLAEPIDGGYRLRMHTRSSNGLAAFSMAAASIGTGAGLAGLLIATGRTEELWLTSLLFAMGIVAGVINAFVLPDWADEREAQFEQIGRRAIELLSTDSEPTQLSDESS